MLPEEYKIRCDKHQFKPFEYCEICYLRNEIQSVVEKTRNEAQSILASTHLAIQVLNNCFDNLEKEINYIKGFLDDMNDNNDKAFDQQIEPQVQWIDKNPAAKDNIFNKEQELFYRATAYRGS